MFFVAKVIKDRAILFARHFYSECGINLWETDMSVSKREKLFEKKNDSPFLIQESFLKDF